MRAQTLAVLLFICCWSGSTGEEHTCWAVLVSTSRYWLNYRHSANVMAMYHVIRRLGVPDSHILLMLAEDHACNVRNPFKATLFSNESHASNVYGEQTEVDYRGYEVTVESFLRVLTGRHDPAVPRNKRLMSDEGSNVLIYMTGHGGNEFLKFQNSEELMAQDLADALSQMAELHRYNQVLLMVETCEAFTLTSRITAPRVIAMGSSIIDEKSLSHKNDFEVGQSLLDRFTHLTLHFLENLTPSSPATFTDLMGIYSYKMMKSTFAYRVTPGLSQPVASTRLTDFFGSVASVRSVPRVVSLKRVTGAT